MTGDLARTDVTPFWKPERSVKVTPRPKSASVKRADASEKEARKAWFAAVSKKRLSTIWTAEDYPAIAAGQKIDIHCHHIVSRQECRKHDAPEWDARNGVPVSKRRHERHHSRLEPLRRDELPGEVFAFVAENPKLLPYFNCVYPVMEDES